MWKLLVETKVRAALVVLVLSILVRFWQLGTPAEVIFDEVHFGKFVSAYCCTHEHFFDIHPPAAKLLIAGSVKLFSDYDGKMGFKKISEPYRGISPWAFRLVPAIFGSLIPVMVYLTLLTLGAGVPGAFLGGIFFVFDNGFVLQSRVIALDNQLIFFELAALTAMFQAVRAGTGLARMSWSMLAGAAAALAVGSKLTGLVAVSIPLLVWAWFFGRDLLRTNLRRVLVPLWFLVAGVTVYLSVWYVHFSLLDQPGFGDRFYKIKGNFFEDLIRFHYVMYERNASLTKTHHYASPWSTWPVMIRGIFYWKGNGQHIYFLGNPVVWVGSTLMAMTAVGVWVLKKCSHLQVANTKVLKRPLLWITVVAYLNAYVPYMTVSRELFLYHYMPPLVFLIIAGILWLEQMGVVRAGSFASQRRVYYGMIVLVVIGFLALAPLTYGWHTPKYVAALFNLVPSWR